MSNYLNISNLCLFFIVYYEFFGLNNDAGYLDVTTNPAAGDVTGNYSVGFGLINVGGQTPANVAIATNIVNSNPNLDLDDTDDLALTTNPAAGDVTGNYSVGLGVATVGGQTAANIGSATNTVITAPALDLDTSDDPGVDH